MSKTSSSLRLDHGHRWYNLSNSDMTALPSVIPAPIMIAGPWSLLLICEGVRGADDTTELEGSADEEIADVVIDVVIDVATETLSSVCAKPKSYTGVCGLYMLEQCKVAISCMAQDVPPWARGIPTWWKACDSRMRPRYIKRDRLPGHTDSVFLSKLPSKRTDKKKLNHNATSST